MERSLGAGARVSASRRLTGVIGSAVHRLTVADDSGARRFVVLFSPSLADYFLDAYQSVTGYVVNPWWDLHGLAHFSDHWLEFIPVQVARRRQVDLAGMPERIEEVFRSILARM